MSQLAAKIAAVKKKYAEQRHQQMQEVQNARAFIHMSGRGSMHRLDQYAARDYDNSIRSEHAEIQAIIQGETK